MTLPAPVIIGNRLKEAREKKAISLDEVHAKIKIHPRIIQILEEDKFEKLPSPLFAKSFLKSYAEFLEVNPEEILDAYDKHGTKRDPEQVLYLKTADEKIKESRSFQNRFSSILPLVLAAALVGGALFYVSSHFQRWADRRETRIPKDRAESRKTQSPSQPAAASDRLRSVEAGNFPKIASNQELTLKIRALDSVWLHVTCDGKVLFQSILKKGAVESWTAAKSIQVWTGNASSMSLSLNNFALGSPGKGSVKKMLITREGVKALS